MNGSEQLLFVKNCDLEVSFPECENIYKSAQLWKKVLDIYEDLR